MSKGNVSGLLYRVMHFFDGVTYGVWLKILPDTKWVQVTKTFRWFKARYSVGKHIESWPGSMWRFNKTERLYIKKMKEIFGSARTGTFEVPRLSLDETGAQDGKDA